MNFKYFDDYKRLSSLTDEKVLCEFCNQVKTCFDTTFYGKEEIKHICPQCLFDKKLYTRQAYTNNGDSYTLLIQIKDIYKHLTEEQQNELTNERTKELEQATPSLITWQDMNWLCLDGDYAKFIGYGSKPFLNSLAENGNGQNLFRNSLHPDLQEYYSEEQWIEMVPDKLIVDYNQSSCYGTLFYIFKSLTTDKIAIWWDCD